MRAIAASDVNLAWRDDGSPLGPPVLFSNSLGTDCRIWDDVISKLPEKYRFIRYDGRGHGLSGKPHGPYQLEQLVDDALALLNAIELRPVVVVGLSLGGLVAQRLAMRAPDRVSGIVVSNSAARMGSPSLWAKRIEAVREHGMQGIADGVLERWFGGSFRQNAADISRWREMLAGTDPDGYRANCASLAHADLFADLPQIQCPMLAVAGSEDMACDAAQVEATANEVSGARCVLMQGVGHLPPVEAPAAFASILEPFLEEVAHE